MHEQRKGAAQGVETLGETARAAMRASVLSDLYSQSLIGAVGDEPVNVAVRGNQLE